MKLKDVSNPDMPYCECDICGEEVYGRLTINTSVDPDTLIERIQHGHSYCFKMKAMLDEANTKAANAYDNGYRKGYERGTIDYKTKIRQIFDL